jgi:hypothetical protein
VQLAFWLLPCERDRAALAEIIAQLAQRFGVPEFEPHVTIYAGPLGENDDAEALVNAAAEGFAPIALQPLRMMTSPVFTKTLFIEFEPGDELARMHGRLSTRVEKPSGYVLSPHLSLLYASLDDDARAGLLREISRPSAPLCFDAVCAVLVPDKIERSSDVSGWQIVARRVLT